MKKSVIDEAIMRITLMEACFDTLLEGAAAQPPIIDSNLLHTLTEYYEGELWRLDYELDEKGYLPPELERGVLSEDGVYDFLAGLKDKR